MSDSSSWTVLVVDDEALIRAVGSDALSDAGYAVLEAGSADEAIEVLEKADSVQVLFTDIRMPGSMDGLQLATLVHDRWPSIKILLTSGDTWPPQNDIPDDGMFLAKPYRLDELCGQVNTLIAGHAG